MGDSKDYEPLDLTGCAVRFQSSLKYSLLVLLKYNAQRLNEVICKSVLVELMDAMSDDECNSLCSNSPQQHKEAGFDEGWSSRFDTWYKFAKELGFVYYAINEPIEFSQSGIELIKSIEPEFAHLENQVFLNAFAKYERDNPFRRVKNSNKPLILLLQTIKELKNLYGVKSAGISRLEVPLLLCWQDTDYIALARLIQHIRAKCGFTPSDDVIYDQCKMLLGLDVKSTQGENRFKKTNILREMPDDFIRKMRLTGLVSIRGNGRFIDINANEITKAEYCLKNYGKPAPLYTSARDFFDYMKNIDANLVSIAPVSIASMTERERLFQKWVNAFSLETLKAELLVVCDPRGKCNNEVLKYISEPVRFEFLTALSLAKSFPGLNVKANYVIDDEGLPTTFAPGGDADIICLDKDGNILFEVTLLTGTAQNIREMPAIQRHLEETIKIVPSSFSVMLCPRAHADTLNYSKWLLDTKRLSVVVMETKAFTDTLGIYDNARLYNAK